MLKQRIAFEVRSDWLVKLQYPLLVYTKTADSVKRARCLARQTPIILCYLPPSNSGKMASRFASLTREKTSSKLIFRSVCYLTVLVYTKTTIHLSVGG